jgi:hypothetical protein
VDAIIACWRLNFPDKVEGLDHGVGHCGVLHMTVESMGGNAHTQVGYSADVETAPSMYPFTTPGHAKTEGGEPRASLTVSAPCAPSASRRSPCTPLA